MGMDTMGAMWERQDRTDLACDVVRCGTVRWDGMGRSRAGRGVQAGLGRDRWAGGVGGGARGCEG